MKETLKKCIDEAVFRNIASHVACSVVQDGEVVFDHFYKATPDSLFDLASLTKVIFTTTFVALQYQKHGLALQKRICEITDIPAGALQDVTLEDLLRHQSGLPDWHDFQNIPKSQLLEYIFSLPLRYKPREKTLYSDVGFILLGALLERELGLQIGQMYNLLPEDFRKQWTPSFALSPAQKELAIPTGDSKKRKNIHADVFDDNCYSLGGFSTHAGLFGTLQSTQHFIQSWIGQNTFISPDTLQLFRQKRFAQDESCWAIGWDVPSADSTAGKNAPPSLIGHLGFTGTSIWIFPEKKIGVSLLTNRTYNGTDKRVMKKFRQAVHEIVWENLG